MDFFILTLIVFSGDALDCSGITVKITEVGELELDKAVLDAASNNVQNVLDCVGSGTKILATVDKIPVQKGLIFNKNITFGSKTDSAELECPSSNIRIR